jgi:hypothetical protein
MNLKACCLMPVACCLIALAILPGCMTPAEQEFEAADVQAVSMYIARAQPAVEAYCTAAGDEQLRADTRALATSVNADCQLRVKRLGTDQQVAQAAERALAIAQYVIAAYREPASQTAPPATTQPSE